MRELTIEEMQVVSGGIDLDTITIEGRGDSGRSDSAGGGRGDSGRNYGHSVSGKTNTDPVTGFPVLPGKKGDRTPQSELGVKSVEINVGIPGVVGATVTIEPKRRESHN